MKKASRLTIGTSTRTAVVCLALLVLPETSGIGATVTGSATARIFAPLTANGISQLRFGAVSAGETSGTVTVTTSGERFAGGGASIGGRAGFGPAEFSVAGTPGADYRIDVPEAITVARDSSGPEPGITSLEVVDLKSFSATIGAETDVGRLDGGGKDAILVGGTLLVPPGAKTGNYRGDVPVTVSYE